MWRRTGRRCGVFEGGTLDIENCLLVFFSFGLEG